ncbi:phosphatidate cytidylyltransferase [Bradyrhizobium roseum]|uniref:phosphatidate cytidylyltransferase n=1 Tax=Bradyrhizobium roseum TaxID=3056648 RepID=UPI0026353C8A|nr:phosphatidate cytidylyltransferase [Bradyrhizobium roseus]WKA31691.1 phosphatidate cytidylyltransferase [Bradyrhizobium roseus]
MTEDKAAPPAGQSDSRIRESDSRNLIMRIAAAAVLIPIAVAIAYAGGWLWTSLVTLAAIGLFVEWLAVVGLAGVTRAMLPGVAALVIAGVCLASGRLDAALVVLGVGFVAVAAIVPERRNWAAAGFLYAAAAEMASVLLRLDPVKGFAALMFVLLIVWVTDSGGYFAGRGIGGPKLWPRVSPKKTWAGAVGGLAASLAVAAGFAAFDLGRIGPLLMLSGALSAVSQLGDLFESAVKRRFGVKDSSHIIPGHGGLMDRLDGFVAAVVLAAVFGFLRGGADGVGRGLMVW